jgi:hypothetical protein
MVRGSKTRKGGSNGSKATHDSTPYLMEVFSVLVSNKALRGTI